MSAKFTQCRYLRRDGAQCTAEAIDPNGDVVLCTKHVARAVSLFRAAIATTKKTA